MTAIPGQGGIIPARPLAAQAHALRAAAALIERAGITGLYVVISGDQITIQVPEHPAVAGGQAVRDTRPGATRGWVIADGEAAGHAVHIFTPIQGTP
jgi:hypothetical protein